MAKRELLSFEAPGFNPGGPLSSIQVDSGQFGPDYVIP
jgi:hypothetical protein